MNAARRNRRTAAATDRQRRYRARLKNGRTCVPVEADATIINFLIDTQWLALSVSESRKEIGKAITNMLKESACAAAKR